MKITQMNENTFKFVLKIPKYLICFHCFSNIESHIDVSYIGEFYMLNKYLKNFFDGAKFRNWLIICWQINPTCFLHLLILDMKITDVF